MRLKEVLDLAVSLTGFYFVFSIFFGELDRWISRVIVLGWVVVILYLIFTGGVT